MTMVKVLSLLLAVACAVIIAFAASIAAYCAGSGLAHALLVGGGAASTALGIYLAAVAAYQ
ncbi:hypothetical protein [Actinomadura mexicana]|uniref:Uncharacterized protein n=1 Tax=Actinomadura mexicana TaxID=134959 RepID=A0A239GYE8_9ACTN|nr:hypothetical protein [Actinomadura mexicana]SNS73064.1 hypothetical protein SAMN06265355_12646 [Actinomadura mexicana]